MAEGEGSGTDNESVGVTADVTVDCGREEKMSMASSATPVSLATNNDTNNDNINGSICRGSPASDNTGECGPPGGDPTGVDCKTDMVDQSVETHRREGSDTANATCTLDALYALNSQIADDTQPRTETGAAPRDFETPVFDRGLSGLVVAMNTPRNAINANVDSHDAGNTATSIFEESPRENERLDMYLPEDADGRLSSASSRLSARLSAATEFVASQVGVGAARATVLLSSLVIIVIPVVIVTLYAVFKNALNCDHHLVQNAVPDPAWYD
jgi:hypothetical protein